LFSSGWKDTIQLLLFPFVLAIIMVCAVLSSLSLLSLSLDTAPGGGTHSIHAYVRYSPGVVVVVEDVDSVVVFCCCCLIVILMS